MTKQIFQQAFIMLLIAATAMGESGPAQPFSKETNDAWLAGKKDAVYQIAKARLEKNSNDLSALLIQLEYALEFADIDQIRRLLPKLRSVAEVVKSEHFEKKRAAFNNRLDTFDRYLPAATRDADRKESYKGFFRNKRMAAIDDLEALEADGLVAPLTFEERQEIQGSVAPAEPTPPYPSNVPFIHETATSPTPSVTAEKVSTRLSIVIAVLVAGLLAGVAVFFLRRR